MCRYHTLKFSERKLTLYGEENKSVSNDVSLRAKAQCLGGKLSVMVLPNLGAFMGWDILTALGTWPPNDILKAFISPVLTYLLPLLITIPGGKMIYGEKGAVIGTSTIMGVITGADISMLLGAMIIAPLFAWLSKKLDAVMEPLIPISFELLIENLTVALLGAVIAIIGYVWIAPAITSLFAVFSVGVSTLENNNLLPLTTILIGPTKALFLNNAIGQGILTPLGATRLNEFGKSVLLPLESNPGPGLGMLLTYCFFGRRNAKANAHGASTIHFSSGIHEIYFPLILVDPLTILAVVAGGITGTLLFTLFNVDLVGVGSPGSVVTIVIMALARDQLLILLAVLASTTVSFLVAAVIVRHSKRNDEDVDKNPKEAAKQAKSLKGRKSRISSASKEKEAVTDLRTVERIVYVCGTGVGSSAMSASVITERLRKAGITGITVEHTRVMELPDPKANTIVTHVSLRQVAHEKQSDIEIVSIEDYLNTSGYDEFVNNIEVARS